MGLSLNKLALADCARQPGKFCFSFVLVKGGRVRGVSNKCVCIEEVEQMIDRG